MTLPLPFDQLAPREFERLCLWLVRREGFDAVEHLGAAGSDQGRDLLASRAGRVWAFQCKRRKSFGAADGKREIAKIRSLPKGRQPEELVFVVTAQVTAEAREAIREAWGNRSTCHFWASTELDERVKLHPEILREFFSPKAAPASRQRQNTKELWGCLLVLWPVLQYLLYEQLSSVSTELLDRGHGPLMVVAFVGFAVTLGSPILLFQMFNGGISWEEIPLFVTTLIATIGIAVLIYHLMSRAIAVLRLERFK